MTSVSPVSSLLSVHRQSMSIISMNRSAQAHGFSDQSAESQLCHVVHRADMYNPNFRPEHGADVSR